MLPPPVHTSAVPRFGVHLRALLVAVLTASGCTRTGQPQTSPAAPSISADPPAALEPTEPAVAPGCAASSFERTSDGVTWRLGDRSIEFASTIEWLEDESDYNYRRRTVHLVSGDVDLAASCYAETDCDVPDDADGKGRWCLVSHGLEGEWSLPALIDTANPCESSLEVLEGLAQHSAAPTCFRAALPIYPGAPWEKLGELSEPLREGGLPAATLADFERLAKAANDADKGYNDPADNAAAAQALRQLDDLLSDQAPQESIWELKLMVARALARVEGRYPATLVGPDEVLYDAWLGVGEDPPKIVPTAAPWARP